MQCLLWHSWSRSRGRRRMLHEMATADVGPKRGVLLHEMAKAAVGPKMLADVRMRRLRKDMLRSWIASRTMRGVHSGCQSGAIQIQTLLQLSGVQMLLCQSGAIQLLPQIIYMVLCQSILIPPPTLVNVLEH